MSMYDRKTGITKAIVVNTDDPAGYNRIQIRIPELHGLMDKDKYQELLTNTAKSLWVDDESLPWAEVCYPFGDTTPPELNQVVWVIFLNGFTDIPVIIGWAGYEYTSEEDVYRIQDNWYTT